MTQPQSRLSQEEFFVRQTEILEHLFLEGWFTQKIRKEHPAYRRWKFCQDVLHQGLELRFPEQAEEMLEFGRILLDTSNLVTLTHGKQDELLIGDLNLYGDGAVQSKIRSRLGHPIQFDDVLLELKVGSDHISKGHVVTPLETRGLPDLRISVPNGTIPLYAECKCLRSVSANRINKVVKEANGQIRAVKTPCYGVAYLDISHAVQVGIAKDAEVPAEVQGVARRVQLALNGAKN